MPGGIDVIAAGGVAGLIAPLTSVLRTFNDEFPTMVNVTGGAANTKGNWAELEDSTTADVTMMRVRVGDTSTSATQINALVDIGTGAAASESVIIANIQAGSADSLTLVTAQSCDYWFPVNIPTGTRIAARCQDAVGSDVVQVSIELYSGSSPGGGVTTMGATTASSNGTAVTAGVNSYGSWTEIEDSTAAAFRYIVPSIQLGEADVASSAHLLQVGTGAAASETAIATYEFRTLSTEAVRGLSVMPWQSYATVPAGSRLAVRVWGGTAAEILQVALHGVA